MAENGTEEKSLNAFKISLNATDKGFFHFTGNQLQNYWLELNTFLIAELLFLYFTKYSVLQQMFSTMLMVASFLGESL